MKRALSCLPLVTFLAGCAAHGPIFTPVPPAEGKAIIYVYRTNQDDGLSARDAHFYFDDRHTFDLSPDGYSYVALTPGQHMLRQEWSWDVVGGKTIEYPLSIQAGETHYFRLVVTFGSDGSGLAWNWSVREVDASTGMSEISTKHLQPPV